ncbi:DUF935 family protein [Bradyrhizobium sp. ORS 285]|uniref:phage portal protein family protein n=1 Tax=Bradyrhizobium sp. ORS 285 TaxID=115808 RepID=UPI00030B2718|nr:DUF935 family protein [Bradyrhizobium sp. ORS 285]
MAKKKIGYTKPTKENETPDVNLGLEIGDTGTRIFSGIVNEEYNPKLVGIKAIQVYDEMRRSDGTIQSTLQMVKQPLLSAEWYVKPASSEQADIDIAEFVEDCLFEQMELPYPDFMRQALLAFDFGHMVFEKVFEVRDLDGAQRIVWKKLAPRMPRSIRRWAMSNGEPGVTQYKSLGQSVDIPWNKLIVFINDREGDNLDGVSVLRAAYKHWYIKTTLEKVDAIAHERQGLGVPYAKLPEGATKKEQTQAEDILKNMRANEHAFVTMPDGYEIGFLDMKSATTRDPSNSLAYHSREISKSILAQFIELGSTHAGGTGGSRALSQNHSEIFLQGEENRARWFAASMKGAIKELVDLNFPGVKKYPELDFEGISQENIQELAQTYAQLRTAGAITAQDADENAFREKMGLPDLDEAGVREEPAQPDPQNPNQKGKKGAANDNDPAEASEHRHGLKKNFSDTFEPFRKLTLAEMRVDFQRIQDKMDELENGLRNDIITQLSAANEKYIAQLSRAANAGDTQAIKDATIKGDDEYRRMLKAAFKGAFEFGKNGAAREIGVPAPANPAEVLSQIDILATTIVDSHLTDIVHASKTAYLNVISQEGSTLQALAAAERAAEETIVELARNTSSIVVSEYINYGREITFNRAQDKIYALQRSELLDSKTCKFCISMDGRVVEKDDEMTHARAFHSYCRGIWVAILTDEENPPKITGVPQSLRDRYGGTVNDLTQPPEVVK